MIDFTIANLKDDLEGILNLQQANLALNLSSHEMKSSGFVTVSHTYDQLLKLNEIEKHVVAKDNDKVIGYLLAMTQRSKLNIPVLIPMFNIFDEIFLDNKKISDFNYIVVGQVCIDKSYRGKGILDNCYTEYKKRYSKKYDFAITEIAKINTRSLTAHKRIGFEEIKNYSSPDNIEWVIVVWDWRKK